MCFHMHNYTINLQNDNKHYVSQKILNNQKDLEKTINFPSQNKLFYKNTKTVWPSLFSTINTSQIHSHISFRASSCKSVCLLASGFSSYDSISHQPPSPSSCKFICPSTYRPPCKFVCQSTSKFFLANTFTHRPLSPFSWIFVCSSTFGPPSKSIRSSTYKPSFANRFAHRPLGHPLTNLFPIDLQTPSRILSPICLQHLSRIYLLTFLFTFYMGALCYTPIACPKT